MKKLLITLLLISPFSFADWGDVYYCQESSFVTIGHGGKLNTVELGKFQFKLDETANAMVFGSGGTLADEIIQLREGGIYPAESWVAENGKDRISFTEGKLLYTMTGFANAFLMSADCEKF